MDNGVPIEACLARGARDLHGTCHKSKGIDLSRASTVLADGTTAMEMEGPVLQMSFFRMLNWLDIWDFTRYHLHQMNPSNRGSIHK
jgi:hypothetical protein